MLLLLTGMSLGQIADLDLLTFNALLLSAMRVSSNLKTEAAWTAMIAAQGTEEVMTNWVKGWQKKANPDQVAKNDISRLIKDVGKGF
jgi:hypothetical protein